MRAVNVFKPRMSSRDSKKLLRHLLRRKSGGCALRQQTARGCRLCALADAQWRVLSKLQEEERRRRLTLAQRDGASCI